MEFSLTMTFATSTGAKVNITINDVKEDLTKAEAQALMDTLIEKNIFSTKSGDLASKVSATVTKKQVTKYELDK